jgi:hypothetical protein
VLSVKNVGALTFLFRTPPDKYREAKETPGEEDGEANVEKKGNLRVPDHLEQFTMSS